MHRTPGSGCRSRGTAKARGAAIYSQSGHVKRPGQHFRDEYIAHQTYGGCPFDPAASTLFVHSSRR